MPVGSRHRALPLRLTAHALFQMECFHQPSFSSPRHIQRTWTVSRFAGVTASGYSLVQPFRRHAVNACKIAVEHPFLVTNRKDSDVRCFVLYWHDPEFIILFKAGVARYWLRS